MTNNLLRSLCEDSEMNIFQLIVKWGLSEKTLQSNNERPRNYPFANEMFLSFEQDIGEAYAGLGFSNPCFSEFLVKCSSVKNFYFSKVSEIKILTSSFMEIQQDRIRFFFFFCLWYPKPLK